MRDQAIYSKPFLISHKAQFQEGYSILELFGYSTSNF